MLHFRSSLILAFAVAATLATICSADPRKLPHKKAETPPTIDGVLNKEEWVHAAEIEGLFDENLGSPCPFASKFYLSTDSKFIYFAGLLHDDEPDKIRNNEYRTNTSLGDDDQVILNIDLNNSLQDFNQFRINPVGATSIGLSGGRAVKREWAGEFVAKARKTSDGWEFEARIPWSVMALPAEGIRTCRFNMYRYIWHLQRSYALGFTNNGHQNDTPVWEQVSIPKSASQRTAKLLPYFYAGYDKDTKSIANAGLDVKSEVMRGVQFVGTVEPDFRNVENQVLSLDFSRFERIAGEARPFFLEGADYTNSRIFQSQRIGRMDVGAKLYGKFDDKTTVGILNANDFGDRNSFVTTIERKPDPLTTFRGGFSSLRTRGLNNDAIFLRGEHIWGGLTAGVVAGKTNDTQVGDGWNSETYLSYDRGFWSFYGGGERTTAEYKPRLGFAPETNLKGTYIGMNYYRPFSTGKVTEIYGGGNRSSYNRTNGDTYRNGTDGYFGINFRNSVTVNLSHTVSDFLSQRDRTTSIGLNFPQGSRYRRIGVGTIQGTVADAPFRQYDMSARYRTLGRMDLSLTHQILRFNGYSSQTIGSLNWDLGRDRFVAGRFVKSGDRINPYLSFRKSGNTGAEYTIVLGDPNAVQFRTAIILKATIPFEIKY